MKRSALLFLVAPLVLAACGGGSGAVDLAYVEQAAQKTSGISSAHMTLAATEVVGGKSHATHGTGDYAISPFRGTFELSTPDLGQVTEVFDGTTAYLSSRRLVGSLPPGKTWLKVDLAQVDHGVASDIASLKPQNPNDTLGEIKAVSSVERVGSETVDGVTTTHYRSTKLDLTKLPQTTRIQAIELLDPDFILDVWIGKRDRYVHRISASVKFSFEGHTSSAVVTIDLSKFGEKVTAAVPPASKTVDAGNKFGRIGGKT
jgi:hypothetical protein